MKIIETLHLLLRRPTKADALILGNLWRNELVRTFLGGIVSEEIITEKILALQSHWDKYRFGVWSVLDKHNKAVIGLCGPYLQEGIIDEPGGREFEDRRSHQELSNNIND